MGASFSVSGGHFSHREHDARFTKRVNDSRTSPAASRCGMCRQDVAFDASAYRCSHPGCTFLLHDGCYRRPETAKGHLGRPKHRLTLAAAARTQPPCSLCAKPLDAPRAAFAYSCGDCGGFQAHPRCYGLPPDVSAQHEHGKLVLRAPSGGDTVDGGGAGDARRPGHRRRCVECGKTRRTAACSYQCPAPACDAELCLRCVLRDGTRRRRRFTPAELYFGQVVGTFIKGILTGMGFPANWFRTPMSYETIAQQQMING